MTIFTFIKVLIHLLKIKKFQIKSIYCFYIDATKWGLILAKKAGVIGNFDVKQLQFQTFDVRSEEGEVIGIRVIHEDIFIVQEKIIHSKAYQSLYNKKWDDNVSRYLRKSIWSKGEIEQKPLLHVVYLIQVISWHMRKNQLNNACLFLNKRCWLESLAEYAEPLGITLISVKQLHFYNYHRLFAKVSFKLRSIYPQFFYFIRDLKKKPLDETHKDLFSESIRQVPKIAVDVNVFFQLQDKSNYSSLFFWQQSKLPARNILVHVASTVNAITKEQWLEAQSAGIHTVARNPGATQVSQVPVFSMSNKPWKKNPGPIRCCSYTLERKFFQEQVDLFNYQKNYWLQFFDQYGLKVAVIDNIWDNSHIPIASAMEELGGIATMSQWAYEEYPSLGIRVADIKFGHSPNNATFERLSQSQVPYHVSIGYQGDHLSYLLKDEAQQLRKKLQKNGAQKIIAFFDEGSVEDGRWWMAHSVMQASYQFLLEKTINEPWLGLILKPKRPGSLPQRLGPVAELLEKAQATGRCHFYGKGQRVTGFPPSGAALSADIAIHSKLYAVTAGLESALAGIPTLLLDQENCKMSRFYQKRLGGKVVFQDWDSIWEVLTTHWNTSKKIPGLGDWSPILDEMDPFRDGKAAERMGTYLHWLIQGFEAKLNRETILADAAERYCKQWGYDKINSIL